MKRIVKNKQEEKENEEAEAINETREEDDDPKVGNVIAD